MRFTVRGLMIAIVAIALTIIPIRWIWRSQGGNLPSMASVRVGMTRAEVESKLGPPSSRGKRADGTSYSLILRPGSLYWIELEFDVSGRLCFFRYDCF